jgi:hypothetical protein
VPNAVIVEHITLAGLTHGKAIHLALAVVSDDYFASLNAASCKEMSGEILFAVLV